ncbi:hypothetical protein [Streptomyces sp. UNOB3_S3]|uniref:hypothetical protein n=1 Tax=Streptomyces sp. UNOB3_S3 TaxID=2871682 RepID=UPI001E4C30F2|nr:hypothetical protein [Streptomyces sp. UNOB3_S3]MCC3776506.1 hypothetical protein [Streptomyces sp. UNOB3_S3]
MLPHAFLDSPDGPITLRPYGVAVGKTTYYCPGGIYSLASVADNEMGEAFERLWCCTVANAWTAQPG